MKFSAKDFQLRLPDEGAGEGINVIPWGHKTGVFIPIFEGRKPDFHKDVVFKSAVWAWRSWILNSDADFYGVPVGFYVEDSVMDDFSVYLHQHGIDWMETCLVWGHSDAKGRDLGKKGVIFSDAVFDYYDLVIQVDADMFVASPGDTKMDFFSRVFHDGLEGEIFAWSTSTQYNAAKAWLSHYVHNGGTLDAFGSDFGLDFADGYLGVRGIMYAFRPNLLKDRQLLTQCCFDLYNDEPGVSVWSARTGNAVGSISDIGIESAGNIEKFDVLSRGDDPYFTHFNTNHELRWRQQIGV